MQKKKKSSSIRWPLICCTVDAIIFIIQCVVHELNPRSNIVILTDIVHLYEVLAFSAAAKFIQTILTNFRTLVRFCTQVVFIK